MLRRWMAALAVVGVAAGCQREHPISVYVDPGFAAVDAGDVAVQKIAVLPVTSAINEADDPDGRAPRMVQSVFLDRLDARDDYRFVSPSTVESAAEMGGWADACREFLRRYAFDEGAADADLLARIGRTVGCDAVLVLVVDTWDQDEVDYRENGTSTTTVGLTLTILDAREEPGKVLFRATDEDYLEGARSEVEGRTIVRSSTGIVRADRESALYRAPPFEDVVPKVVEALVESLPPR